MHSFTTFTTFTTFAAFTAVTAFAAAAHAEEAKADQRSPLVVGLGASTVVLLVPDFVVASARYDLGDNFAVVGHFGAGPNLDTGDLKLRGGAQLRLCYRDTCDNGTYVAAEGRIWDGLQELGGRVGFTGRMSGHLGYDLGVGLFRPAPWSGYDGDNDPQGSLIYVAEATADFWVTYQF